MTYASLDNKKKNSPYATLTTSIESTDTTIPVNYLEYFHDNNTITYTDSAGSRTMKIEVIREERSA